MHPFAPSAVVVVYLCVGFLFVLNTQRIPVAVEGSPPLGRVLWERMSRWWNRDQEPLAPLSPI
jgi:hypothetical protein